MYINKQKTRWNITTASMDTNDQAVQKKTIAGEASSLTVLLDLHILLCSLFSPIIYLLLNTLITFKLT